MRLLPGWLAGQPGGSWTLDGDASIRRRPVDRIAAPLRAMGARIEAREGRLPPFTVTGSPLRGIEYVLPVASAQVKSCTLLAGLLAEGDDHGGRARAEPRPHRAPAARRRRRRSSAPAPRITVRPQDELELGELHVPGDPSSAAFLVAAALLVPGLADRRRRDGGQLDPRRLHAHRAADGRRRSSASWRSRARRSRAGEPVCELDVAHGPLTGTVVEAGEVPLAIDELPLVALLGCFAEGETIVRGAAELRLKETDRIATVVDGLRGLGA